MIELNLLDALMTAGQGLMLASLIYFFYLVIMHGDLLRHADADQGSLQEARPTIYRGEPEHGMPANVLDEIAASEHMARAR
jgi:hypothetical protein